MKARANGLDISGLNRGTETATSHACSVSSTDALLGADTFDSILLVTLSSSHRECGMFSLLVRW